MGKFGKVLAICMISLTPLIESGLDVPGIPQTMAERANAGNDRGNLKQGQNRDREER